MTGLDIVSAALRKNGVLASGESLDAASGTDGLAELNRMLATWSTEDLLVYSRVRETFTLSGGVSSYSMGSGATLDTTRPIKIIDGAISIANVEYRLRVITVEEYARLKLKNLQGIPGYLYPEGAYPNETLNFYPVPTTNYTFVCYSWKPIPSVASLSTTLSLPPGYEDAIVYNLAVRLAPDYGKQPDPIVVELAVNGKAALKRLNSKPQFLYVDNGLTQIGSSGRSMSIAAFDSGDF